MVCIEEGHRSTAFCHLGNISYQLGKQSSLDIIYEKLGENPFLLDVFSGFQIHLSTHGIDIATQLPVMEPQLFYHSE